MFKSEAIGHMQNGKKITHRLFSDEEYITMKDDQIVDENGYKFDPDEFWEERTGEHFQDGWELYNEELMPENNDANNNRTYVSDNVAGIKPGDPINPKCVDDIREEMKDIETAEGAFVFLMKPDKNDKKILSIKLIIGGDPDEIMEALAATASVDMKLFDVLQSAVMKAAHLMAGRDKS